MEKTLCVALLGIALVFGAPPPRPHGTEAPSPQPIASTSRPLLGSKECTWGPSYWCSNLTASAGCHATKHCIQTVWQHKRYPEDTDSVCQICKKMVTEARDQLESNETMDEIRQVFDGSCKLIPLKVVSQECCKMADNFIPELVETLASQMNPDIVCSVAGLCNNAEIDRMLAEQEEQKTNDEIVTKHPEKKMDTCAGCHQVVDLLEHKFNGMSRDAFLQYLLQMCGRFSTFSDACSNIIITYFNEIYAHMKKEFNSNNVCLMSGECSVNFHVHKIDVTPNSEVGVVAVHDDNLPCELCEQLIGHLRDLLVANTTETEFEKVLEGLCGQTQGFKAECLSIVHEYYPVIYSFLTDALNSTQACVLIQICPSPTGEEDLPPIMPLLPVENVEKTEQLTRVGLINGASNVKVVKPDVKFEGQSPELMQLPIERLNNPLDGKVFNRELCTFCEYFLHYLQTAITDPKTEKNIEDTIDRACNILPNSVNETCVQFVQTYGDALVALLAQEIDPSTICPLIRVCPGKKTEDIEIFMQTPTGDKPNCPLCLFAVTKLDEMIKDERSKENIKKALNNLCTHLSGSIREECEDFVLSYTDELIEMLIDDFKPQEVCVYLKLCTDQRPAPKLDDVHFNGIVSTNEIPDFTANGKPVTGRRQSGNLLTGAGDKPACVLCEFVMEKVQNDLKDKKTEDEIKNVVYGICNHMPKTVSKQCDGFVDQYADMVIALLVSSMQPDEICAYMKLCQPKNLQMTIAVPVPKVEGGPFCVICKVVIAQLEKLLPQNVTEAQVKVALESVCDSLPRKMSDDCTDFIDKYGDKIAEVLVMVAAPGEVCSLLFLCEDNRPQEIASHFQRCAICEAAVMAVDKIMKNPKVNHSIEHVMEKACRALPLEHQNECKLLVDEYGYSVITYIAHLSNPGQICTELKLCSSLGRVKRQQQTLVGGNKCTWGPSYWCDKQSNARECSAVQHCTERVWPQTGTPSE